MLDVFLGGCPEQHSHCLVGALKQRQEPWADSTGPAASAAVMLQWGVCHPVVAVVSLAKPAQTCWSMQPRHSSPAVWISCACAACALEDSSAAYMCPQPSCQFSKLSQLWHTFVLSGLHTGSVHICQGAAVLCRC